MNNFKVNFEHPSDVAGFSQALRRRVVPWQKVIVFCRSDRDVLTKIPGFANKFEQVGFGLKCETWRAHWRDDYGSENQLPTYQLRVKFPSENDRREFMRRLGLSEDRKRTTWWPVKDDQKFSKPTPTRVKSEQGRFPVYVISKGRWTFGRRMTQRALDALGIRHHLVVEENEMRRYAQEVGRDRLLVLPFSDLGKGSIPARNWCWEHALNAGADRHWILDDNINGFYSYNHNIKWRECTENPLKLMEDFVLRYTNVGLAGPQYEFFVPRRDKRPPYLLNTRVYSCILVDNNLPFRWRGRYNEDTDLSLRVLKEGLCTVLFNRWLIKKMPTMTVKGGNTDQLYQGDGRLKMAESLMKQHPDVVRVIRRWGRPQHYVDYRGFKCNKLIPV